MSKLELDFNYLKSFAKDPNRIPLRGSEDRIIRVAFDFFRMQDDETDGLWQVQADDDGNEFLVRTYDLPEEEVKTASDWSVLPDKQCANLTIAYKNVPIHRIASAQYGVENKNDVFMLRSVLLEKLADKEFVGKLVKELPREKINILAELGVDIDEMAEKVLGPEETVDSAMEQLDPEDRDDLLEELRDSKV